MLHYVRNRPNQLAVAAALTAWASLAAAASESVVQYQVTFDATWSVETHPFDFPEGAHFSGLVGGTHDEQVSFWHLGGIASQGIEDMAELGSKTALISEVNAAILDGTAYSILSGGGISRSPGTISLTFSISSAYPLVTLVSMIAPSPDWFVGVHDVPLYESGQWVDEVVVPLDPYDAGTDAGASFTSPDDDMEPQDPISDLSDTYPFAGTPPLGTFTFRLLTVSCQGDINEDGLVDLADLSVLLSQYGTAGGGVTADMDGDGDVDIEDLSVLLAYFGSSCD